MLLTEQAVGSISSERNAKAWFIWTLSCQVGTFSYDQSIQTLYTWIGIYSTLFLRKIIKSIWTTRSIQSFNIRSFLAISVFKIPFYMLIPYLLLPTKERNTESNNRLTLLFIAFNNAYEYWFCWLSLSMKDHWQTRMENEPKPIWHITSLLKRIWLFLCIYKPAYAFF